MSAPTLTQASAAFLEALELSDRSPHTLASYARALDELAGSVGGAMPVQDLQAKHVRGFLLDLSRRPKRPGHQHRARPQGKLARETLRGYHRVLSSFFSWARREGAS